MSDADERYRRAIGEALDTIKAAQDEADYRRPRTPYPLARRLWWRVFGIPADVRRTQLRERKERAEIHLEALRRSRTAR